MVEEGVLETKITELKEAFYFLSDTITKASESAKIIPEISTNLKDIKGGVEQLLASTGKIPESKKDDLMQKINELNTTLELLKGNEGSFSSIIETNTKIINQVSQLKESVEEIKQATGQKIQEHLQEVTDKVKGIQEYSENLKTVVEKLNRIDTQLIDRSGGTSEPTGQYQGSKNDDEDLRKLLIEIKEKIDSVQDIKSNLDNLTEGIAKDHDQLFTRLDSLKNKESIDPTIINSGNSMGKQSEILEKLDAINQQQKDSDLPGLKNALETLASQVAKINQVEMQSDVETVKKLHETTTNLLQELKSANFDPSKFDLNNDNVIELLKQKFDITGQALKIIYEKQKEFEEKLGSQPNQDNTQTQTAIESHSEMLDQVIGKINEIKQQLNQQKTMLEAATQKPEKTEDSSIPTALTAMAGSFDKMITEVKNDSNQSQEHISRMREDLEVNNAKMILALEQVKNVNNTQKAMFDHENSLNQSIERLEKHYEQTNLILAQLNKANQEVQNSFNAKLELLNNTIQATFKTLESDAKLQKTSTDTLIQILIKISENIDGLNKKTF
ncbi:Chromosome partition protein Smc [uncultured archaeon]|nr:Chromosome partition protein Smc [uncultured archaeon]